MNIHKGYQPKHLFMPTDLLWDLLLPTCCASPAPTCQAGLVNVPIVPWMVPFLTSFSNLFFLACKLKGTTIMVTSWFTCFRGYCGILVPDICTRSISWMRAAPPLSQVPKSITTSVKLSVHYQHEISFYRLNNTMYNNTSIVIGQVDMLNIVQLVELYIQVAISEPGPTIIHQVLSANTISNTSNRHSHLKSNEQRLQPFLRPRWLRI